MKLIFIYGPPAVGKKTVARELARLTGFKLFDGHQTQDIIFPLFQGHDPAIGRLLPAIRLNIFEQAAQADIDIIFTACYVKDSDDRFVADTRTAIKGNKGETIFVRLYCDIEEECRRVVADSRHASPCKYHTTADLLHCLKHVDIRSRIDFISEHLEIDNTAISPATAARQILAHYNFPLKPTDIDRPFTYPRD